MRYLRLYLCFLRFSFSKAMEFRFDFFFRVFMDMLWYVVHLTFFTVLFDHTGVLGGWTLDQVYVFAASIFLMDAIQMTVLSNNMWWLPIYVNRGDLDYYLVRPVSSLFFLSVRDFAANSFLNLLVAIGIAVWALARYPEPVGAGAVALYVVLQLAGVFLFYTLSMLSVIPVFWLHATSGVRDSFWSLQRFSQRPHTMYPNWMRRLLLSFLPFAFIASMPVTALFEGPSAQLVLHTGAVVGTAFALMLWAWRRGLRAYASASS